uniref:Uncharacterized protein n=1 Tax=Salvator merianae TaxID=96440 RepID=A0A8D0DLG0_SALMN
MLICNFLYLFQVLHLEDYENGALFSSITHGPYPLIITFMLLCLDSMLYLLLGVYLDQVMPGDYGLRRSFLFFLKPSFWAKRLRNYKQLDETSVEGNLDVSGIIEPVPPEFQGKNAIRYD